MRNALEHLQQNESVFSLDLTVLGVFAFIHQFSVRNAYESA